MIPDPVANPGLGSVRARAAVCDRGSFGLRWYARKQLFDSGRFIRIWPYVLGLLIGLPLVSALLFGKPVTFDFPVLQGIQFRRRHAGDSGIRRADAGAVDLYRGLHRRDRARRHSVGAQGADGSRRRRSGLSRGSTLRLIVVPQALRVILPPLTNQYLNLTKNSSLAVAIGYPDLVSVFAGTALSQTGQAIEIISITMGVYLLISLVTSAIMNFYGRRLGRSAGP